MQIAFLFLISIQNLTKKAKTNDQEAKNDLLLMNELYALLSEGKPIRLGNFTDEKVKQYKSFNLLTSKPILYVCNVDENSPIDVVSPYDYYYTFESGSDKKLGVFSSTIDLYLNNYK